MVRVYSQSIDLENALSDFRKKYQQTKKLKITGGISSSTTYSMSTAGGLRDPFVYSINGNVNFSFLSINIPVSLSYTNAGFSYSYQYPRPPSRLSIHPKYKWVQAHIGDFSMNFSPYTMSGFQIKGAGVDLQPKGKWKYSAFYGRFQKAVPYLEGNGNTLATYKRVGAGIKLNFTEKKFQSALSIIRINDLQNSLLQKPDSLHIYPKANIAFGFENKLKLAKSLQIEVELGISYLTNDVRAQKDSVEPAFHKIIGLASKMNASTTFYKALKTNLSYTLGSSTVGIGYERIDPGYQTLGAYYFTNDMENITVNFAQQLFKNKLNLSMNAGIQQDDLKNEKTGKNRRMVTAINASINGGKKFTSSLGYSNFQTFTNIKPQFQYINQLTPYDNLDTLNYRQLSQTANANVNLILRSDTLKSKVLNMNFSFQDSYDEQGGIISKGNASQFYNLAVSYSSIRIPQSLNIAYGFNATYNTIGIVNMVTAGPMINCGKGFFDKQLKTSISAAYNISLQQGVQQQKIISGRFNASYTLRKKHQLGLNGVYMHRVVKGKSGQDFSTSVTYSYSF
ncbi:MAG TPA: hypothetical protein VF487_09880 [Chitinophagaceae bacterium]